MSPGTSLLWRCLGFLIISLPLIHSCETGTPRDCAESDFAPGSDLAGEGFDITKMQRKGSFVINMKQWRHKDKTCTLCRNPYIEGKKQKLPLSVVDWRPSQKCSVKVSSSVYQSSESLLTASTSCIENNWNVNLGINTKKYEGSLMLAGTNSKLAEYLLEKTKKDKFSFASHSISCGYYSYRISNKPLLHPEFKRAVSQLPKQYDNQFKPRFYKLIDNFGTHFITKVTEAQAVVEKYPGKDVVTLGGKVHSVTSIKQCQVFLNGLSVDEVKTCLDVEASASVQGKASSKVDIKHCDNAMTKTESKSSFSRSFSDRLTEISGGHTTEPELLFSADKDPGAYKEWLSSIPLHPEVLSYSLQPLHELLPINSPVRKHLRQAIHDFILEKSLWRNCSDSCTIGAKHNPQEPCACTCNNMPGMNHDCCPSKPGLARVKITIIRASGLWGDHTTGTDGYVKVLAKNSICVGRTAVIYNNNAPHWVATYDLGDVVLSEYDSFRLEVWDEDNKWDDDLLGACTVTVTAGTLENFCNLDHGVLYYKTSVLCAPTLGGPACSKYVGSPMNSQLEKTYLSRHARPVPQSILREMGVLLDEHRVIVIGHEDKGVETFL